MLQLPLRWVVAILMLATLGLTACEQAREDSLAGEPTAVGGGALVLEETPDAETEPGTDTPPITDTETVTTTEPVTGTDTVPPEPTPAGEVPSTPGTDADPNATADPNAQPTTVAVDGATPEPGSEGPETGGTEPAAEGTYTVQAGDTLFSIAVQFNTTVEELIALNSLDPNQPLTVGQVIRVPAGGTAAPAGDATPAPAPPTATPVPGAPRTHTVQPGEWIYQIARDYGVDPLAIIAANPGIDPNNVQPGQVLVIP